MGLRNTKYSGFWTVGYSEANWNIWYIGKDTGLKKTNGDRLRMLRVQDVSYQSFTARTQKHHNTYPPSISLTSPSVPYPTSLTPQTQYRQDGPWAVMPLRGGVNVRVCPIQHLP